MKAAVVALGKIGLPLAVQIASQGVPVVGADIDGRVVEMVGSGEPPFPGEADLERRLRDVVAAGTLRATTDTAAAVAEADVVVVVVPLVVDAAGRPDFGALDAATEAVGAGLRHGALVVYETTVPVGTTRRRLGPRLEQASSLAVGRDFHLAHSPERVSSGRVFADLRRYPKLVGGVDAASAKAAVRFYERVLEFDDRSDLDRPNGVWDLGGAEAAEFAKLAETTYRDVNIALANEFAAHAEDLGLDIAEITAAANSQPFSHIHRPGIAVGGHCIPVYPRFYLTGHPEAQLPAAARAVNAAQPERLVERLARLAGGLSGRRVAVLGAAYRGGVKETAFSGVFDVVAAVAGRGGRPLVHDPLYDDAELTALGLEPYHLGEPCDAAVVQADHDGYRRLVPADLPGCGAVVDGRGVLPADGWEAAGIRFARIGAG
jgi:nucleotide sugar dehydrogenase